MSGSTKNYVYLEDKLKKTCQRKWKFAKVFQEKQFYVNFKAILKQFFFADKIIWISKNDLSFFLAKILVNKQKTNLKKYVFQIVTHVNIFDRCFFGSFRRC